MKLGLRCPDRFAAVASLSGCLDIVSTVERRGIGNDLYWQSIFGSIDALKGSDDDLFALAEKVAVSEYRPKLFACCGTEDFLYEDNQAAVKHFNALGLDLSYREGAGNHSWEFWDCWIREILKWLPIKR